MKSGSEVITYQRKQEVAGEKYGQVNTHVAYIVRRREDSERVNTGAFFSRVDGHEIQETMNVKHSPSS